MPAFQISHHLLKNGIDIPFRRIFRAFRLHHLHTPAFDINNIMLDQRISFTNPNPTGSLHQLLGRTINKRQSCFKSRRIGKQTSQNLVIEIQSFSWSDSYPQTFFLFSFLRPCSPELRSTAPFMHFFFHCHLFQYQLYPRQKHPHITAQNPKRILSTEIFQAGNRNSPLPTISSSKNQEGKQNPRRNSLVSKAFARNPAPYESRKQLLPARDKHPSYAGTQPRPHPNAERASLWQNTARIWPP